MTKMLIQIWREPQILQFVFDHGHAQLPQPISKDLA